MYSDTYTLPVQYINEPSRLLSITHATQRGRDAHTPVPTVHGYYLGNLTHTHTQLYSVQLMNWWLISPAPVLKRHSADQKWEDWSCSRRKGNEGRGGESLFATLTREGLIESTRHQVLAPAGRLPKNGSVFIYSGVISAAGRGETLLFPCQRRFGCQKKTQAAGSRGVQIAN